MALFRKDVCFLFKAANLKPMDSKKIVLLVLRFFF